MPVRQPTAKLRKNRRKGPVQGPETKVRGIKAESGWENAMEASDRRYVVVHVLSVRSAACLSIATQEQCNTQGQFNTVVQKCSRKQFRFWT